MCLYDDFTDRVSITITGTTAHFHLDSLHLPLHPARPLVLVILVSRVTDFYIYIYIYLILYSYNMVQ